MKARGEYDICFSDNITDRMLGNLPLLESLCKKLGVKPGVPRAGGRVAVALTLCAGIIGAKKGFLYLRGEYLYMRETLEKELQKRRDLSLGTADRALTLHRSHS